LRVIRERIAVVTTSYPEHAGDPSGHFVEAEVHALGAAGADVDVFALRGSAFGWPGVASRVKKNPLLLLNAAREIARISAAISRKPYFSRLIAHWAIPSAFPISRDQKNIEVVSHGADVRLLTGLPPPIRTRLTERIMQNATTWRFASVALRDELLVSLPASSRSGVEAISKIVAPTLDFNVDVKAIAKAHADQRSLSGSRPTFVSVARLVASKRVDRSIAIAVREHATLFVIGDGPERKTLERLTHERRANAYFLGSLSRPETLAHIAAADALLHTSEAEGLSSVVREAEHLGTRVIRI
jgi:teichuronic acid biosynthesis glycosyltransferase TuaC